jgi:hypothetical protein
MPVWLAHGRISDSGSCSGDKLAGLTRQFTSLPFSQQQRSQVETLSICSNDFGLQMLLSNVRMASLGSKVRKAAWKPSRELVTASSIRPHNYYKGKVQQILSENPCRMRMIKRKVCSSSLVGLHANDRRLCRLPEKH